MVKKESEEWISKGDKDLEEAKFLLANGRPLEDVAFFVHQSAEKYLKGFLLTRDWELEKIHDLVKLAKEAIKYDKGFEKFIPDLEIMTDFYVESRYPVGYEVTFEKDELEKSIKTVSELKNFIKKILAGLN